MNETVELAILSVQKANKSFCRFISANDVGATGSHQSGFYIPKGSAELLFDTPGTKGENKDKTINIKWQNDFDTISRAIYYGTGTRNEYRLTRFGKGFPFLNDDNVGDLFILSHIEADQYEGYVLSNDDDIEDFFTAFDLTSNETNKLINKTISVSAENKLLGCFNGFIALLNKSFPSTIDLANTSRTCFNTAYGITNKKVIAEPDKGLLQWLNAEYQLFKAIELEVYSENINVPFNNLDTLINFANTILNRRKSRAGKSLENHLAEVFKIFDLKFEPQCITEDYKKPDFIFPGKKQYHDNNYDKAKLVFLASKTTCKDRWRQIINEADRIEIKHLFTLQQGISKNQLNEMYKEGVRLVVPKPYISSFPKEYQEKIFSLEGFISFTNSKQK
ncbi:restriction endonuclease [Mucilaginibacter rigui]|uniref:Restriction endonuclease n=1 Tax=Mucilaginibacter rigui TaxID=534635 RepID=A0ABR7X5M4_9SPHI|nr:type II restriction endonuclease [Mucilaginibacter rigui]MBD1385142.1 restriction endonuclease [Mucilaginibacter rigui]